LRACLHDTWLGVSGPTPLPPLPPPTPTKKGKLDSPEVLALKLKVLEGERTIEAKEKTIVNLRAEIDRRLELSLVQDREHQKVRLELVELKAERVMSPTRALVLVMFSILLGVGLTLASSHGCAPKPRPASAISMPDATADRLLVPGKART
jgi:hypothetical protein